METFWFFWLPFRRAYDSDFWFSLGHKRSYDSAYDSDSDSVALVTQEQKYHGPQSTKRYWQPSEVNSHFSRYQNTNISFRKDTTRNPVIFVNSPPPLSAHPRTGRTVFPFWTLILPVSLTHGPNILQWLERFSCDLEMKTRKNRNNKQTDIERFDWFIERIQMGAFPRTF